MEEFRIISDDLLEETVRPKDLILDNNIKTAGVFGKHEIEVAAGKLLMFFQEKNRWSGFTIEDLFHFLKKKKIEMDSIFFGLCGPWYDDCTLSDITKIHWAEARPYVVSNTDGKFYVTDLFIRALLEKK